MLTTKHTYLLAILLLVPTVIARPEPEYHLRGATTNSEVSSGSVIPNPDISMPLDVENYPLPPPGLELQQVHVYVRHGERTPVGIRMSNPPASIPEHWMMCKSARRFRAAVWSTPASAAKGTDSTRLPSVIQKPEAPGSSAASLPDGETLRMRKTVERSDGTRAEGECLLGELTDIGRQSTYGYGQALRRLYIDRLGFLPDTISGPHETYFRSTNMPRTIESLQHIIHGLYPTSKVENEGVTEILVRNGKDESAIPNSYVCKRLEVLLTGFAQAAAAAYNHTLEKLDPKVSKYLDDAPLRIDGKPRASGVLDTLRAAIANGVKIPREFEEKEVMDTLEKAVVREWFEGYKTEEVRRLGMGRLLQDLSTKLQKKAEKGAEDPTKILVTSTHDTALAALAATLDVYDEKWPAFTSSITFELFREKEESSADTAPPTVMQNVLGSLRHKHNSSAHYVRMRYQNRTLALPVCAEEGRHLPGAPEFCTLEAFRERVHELTPEDFEAECAPGGRQA